MIDHTKIINSLTPSAMQHGLQVKPSQDESPKLPLVYRDHPEHGLWVQGGVRLHTGEIIWCYSTDAAEQLRAALFRYMD